MSRVMWWLQPSRQTSETTLSRQWSPDGVPQNAGGNGPSAPSSEGAAPPSIPPGALPAHGWPAHRS